MNSSEDVSKKRSAYLEALLDDEADALTPNAKKHFGAAVQEYAEKLFTEAGGIEALEHSGHGPPEITGAHIEEAKWVLVRRLRRRGRHHRWVIVLRFVQALATVLFGYGLSNLSTSGGAFSFASGALIGSLSLVIEQNISREA